MTSLFHPDPIGTVSITVAATSGRVQVYPERGPVAVRIFNDGTATVWISFGDSAVAATTGTGVPIASQSDRVFSLDNIGDGPLYAAAIAAAATGIVYFTPGSGGN